MNRRSVPWQAAVPVAWLLAFLVVPAAIVAAKALSAEGLRSLLAADTARLLWRSFRIAAETTGVCLVLAYPLAAYIAGSGPWTRALLLFLVVLPSWTNLLVRTCALQFLFRPLGILWTEAAVVLGLVHGYLPFMVLPLYLSLEKVPDRLLEAARDLGCSPASAFLRVTVPLTLPGIAAGSILVFIPVLGTFATPELLGGADYFLLGSRINDRFVFAPNPVAGSADTLVLVGFTLVLAALYHRVRGAEGLL